MTPPASGAASRPGRDQGPGPHPPMAWNTQPDVHHTWPRIPASPGPGPFAARTGTRSPTAVGRPGRDHRFMKQEPYPLCCPVGDAADWAWPLAFAERACCFPARPAVTAVMPPAPGRPYRTDLLLCRHHYQASETALLAAGASVYDETGIVSPAGEEPVPAHQAARAS